MLFLCEHWLINLFIEHLKVPKKHVELKAFTGTCVLSKAEQFLKEINRISRAGLDAGYAHLICNSGKSFLFLLPFKQCFSHEKHSTQPYFHTQCMSECICCNISIATRGAIA